MTSETDRLEADIDQRSAAFKKELGLRDLVLTQVLFIVGLGWVGTAARLGPSHVIFWLLAILFFYLPSAAVVIHLNRLMPLEGGLYQWAKLGFNELTGFLVAWNLWIYAIVSVMFALPIAGFRGTRSRAPLWLKLAAASGFLMTALYVTLSVFPIVPVGNVALFTTKITLVILGTNAAGAMLFVLSRRVNH